MASAASVAPGVLAVHRAAPPCRRARRRCGGCAPTTSTRTPTTPCPCTLPHSARSTWAGLVHGGVVGVRGQRDGAPPPVPHPDRDRHHGHAAHQVERLPAGGVQQERLVDREVRGDAACLGRGRRDGQRLGALAASRPGCPVRAAAGSVVARSRQPHRGPRQHDRVEVLEAPHPVAPQGAVDHLVALRRAPGSRRRSVAPCSSSPASCCAHVLAGQLARRPCAPCSPARPAAGPSCAPAPMEPSM